MTRFFRHLVKKYSNLYVALFLAVKGVPTIPAGAADPYVRQARGVFTGTVGSTALTAGDAVYFDGTDWEKADADDATKFAEAIATNNFASGEVGTFCRSCIIVDTDAPYTQGDQYYLSETAGALTATRPTTDGALRQCLGFALSTSELYVDIPPVKELNVHLDSRGATSAYALLDSGNFGGATLDAQNETAVLSTMVPQNAVGVEIAYGWTAAEATAGTPTYDITVGSTLGATGTQHDAVTADATLANQAAEGGDADEILRFAMTTGFDATNIIRPGALLGVKFLADDGGTDIRFALGVDIVFLVV